MTRELSIAFQTDKTASDYIMLAKLVNQYDFDAITVYCDVPFQPSYGPLMLMAPYIERARLGPAAVSPSRIHPIDIAAQTALLAELARGGVYIGIARGAWLPQHSIRELRPPIQAIYEAVEIVRYFLSGRSDGYAGQVFQIAPNVRAPYPLPKMPIPVLIGSWGPKLGAVAGEIADEIKIGGTSNPDIIPVIQSYIRIGELSAGRDTGSVKIVAGAVCVVDEDRNQARSLARREVALYLPVVAELDPTVHLDPEFVKRLRLHAARLEYELAGRLISDDLLDRFAFSGNVDDIIRQAEALFAAGANRIEFGTPHGIQPANGIQLLGEHVVPIVKRM